MKIKKILIYLIFAFVMVLPFNVNAETIVRTENFQLLHNKDFSSTVINQLKQVIYYHFTQTNNATFECSSSGDMDSCLQKYDIFVDYDEMAQTFRVYYILGKQVRDITLNDSGISFLFTNSKVLKVKVSDLSIISFSSGQFTSWFDNLSNSYNILMNSNYVCIGDLYNNCGNTGLDDTTTRDINFWKKYNLVDDNGVIYDNFNDLYVYSSIVWSNIDFKWSTNIYFKSLDNVDSSEYKAFTYNLDSDGSYGDKYTTTKTILLDASLYDTYELKFEAIGNKSDCVAKNIFGQCSTKIPLDNYVINVYNKSISNVKYYLSADNESWDKIKLKSQSSSDYVSYYDIDWNGKYGKYVFDLTGIEDYVLITISYDNSVISFKTPELQIAEEDMTELDITGKYAVGLIPKNASSPVPLYYQGNFVTYYYFGDSTSAYEYKLLKSSDHISKYTIDFTNYNLNKPIFYILNLDYKIENTSIIKYYANYFDVIYFENDYELVTYNDSVYNPPRTDVDIETGGDDSTDSSNGGVDLSLTSLFKKLPELISGLGNAFIAIGQCVTIAFISLPEIVQSVLYISLIVTIILIAIKLIK